MKTPLQTNLLYDLDFNLWLETTALQLRERDLENLDWDNLIEEIETLGRSEKAALESNLEIVLMHLLKYKYQPEKRSNSWRYTIYEHRSRIFKSLKNSPSLKRYLEEVFDECYLEGRKKASLETGLPIETFLDRSPFSQDEVLNPDFLPDS
jgi:hypothetical protein